MRLVIPKDALGIIRKIADLAEAKGYKAYLVGGFVRDLLLGANNLDIDIVVEGDALAFAGYASEIIGAALVKHAKFGTAALIMPEPAKGKRSKIDIASARKEFYRHPAALPSVKFSSIKQDLYRRDFTINAMAVSINRGDFGRLIDFFGGVKDLERRRIRVLHEKSFIDDPTRIFRAVRFEQRYGFKIDGFTARLIRNAVKAEMFERVSGERLREEIELLLKEEEPLKAVKRMKGLDEVRFISPKIVFGAAQERYCRDIKKLAAVYRKRFPAKRPLDMWLVYFMVMIDALSVDEVLRVCGRFAMRRNDRSRLISVKKSEKKVIASLSAKKKMLPSRTYEMLKPLSYEAILFITAKCGSKTAKNRVKDFLAKYDNASISLKGADLERLGVRPGPCFTEILRKTLYAKIDGLISTRQGELAFAEQQLLKMEIL